MGTEPLMDVRPGRSMRSELVEPAAVQPPTLFGTIANAALTGFVAVLLISPQTHLKMLLPLRPAAVCIAIAVAAHLFDSGIRGRTPWATDRSLALAIALLGWALLTAPLSVWPSGSLELITGLFAKSIVVFVLVATLLDTTERLRRFAVALTVLSVPIALTAITHYVQGEFLARSVAVNRIQGFAAPLTGNPNDLALTLSMILPITAALAFLTRSRRAAALLAAVAVTQVIAIVSTFSRGGFVALCVLAVVGLARRWHQGQHSTTALAAIALAAALPLCAPTYWRHLTTIAATRADPTGSAQERIRDMKATTAVVARSPVLGAGIGMNVLALNAERGSSWRQVHNVYLQLAADLGVPGLILFVWLFRCCWRATTITCTGATGGLRRLARGIRGGLLAFGVAALFHPVAYHFYFYTLAGMAVAARAVCRRQIP